jgi:DNA-binding transcriptional regulator YdaS (Cro superfamily)
MRTEATLNLIAETLQTNCGDLYDACRRAGVSLVFVKQWCKDDKVAAERISEAERAGAMALQSEAIRRAVQGVEKGVYFKGERVDTETVYSDGLLVKLLAGRIPETFGKEAEGGGGITINGGQAQINIMPRAESYEDWLRMRDATLARRKDEPDILAAPMKQIEATATPVPLDPFEGLGL